MIQLRWHGRGGQGVVTAAKLLALTALSTGQHIQAFPEFGPERRGAPVQAFTRIDENPIRLYSHVTSPDIIVVLDRTLVGKTPFAQGLKKDGAVVVNCRHTAAELREEIAVPNGRVFAVDATAIANESFGRPITNTPMLGALAGATGIVDVEAVVNQVRETFKDKLKPSLIEGNMEAARRASKEVQAD